MKGGLSRHGTHVLSRHGTHVAVGSGTLAVTVGPVRAHGVSAEPFAPPLPLPWLLAGAGATVALTALLLAVAGDFPAGTRSLATVSASRFDRLRLATRVGFLALVVGAILAGLFDRQVPTENVATVFVWPVWLKGVAIVAILAGSPWRTLSPWRALYDGLCRLEGRRLKFRSYPARLGSVPALLAFLALVGVVENLTTVPRSPALTAGLVAGLTALLLFGGVVFGPGWFARADPLDVLYRLLGRTAPLSIDRDESGDATLVVRAPWQDTTRPLGDRALAAFVVAAVYTVSFDGFVETPEYRAVFFGVREMTGLGPQAR